MSRQEPIDAQGMDIDQLLHIACAAADAAGQATLAHFRQPLEVQNKSPSDKFDPVTQADREAEHLIRKLLMEATPDFGFLGEEGGSLVKPNAPHWVVDPIDGTRAYITGMPLWGTLIALNQDGNVLLGVLDQPFLGERFTAKPGCATLHDRQGCRRLRTRTNRTLAEAVLQTTTPEMFTTEAERKAFARVAGRAAMTRFGGDCYNYALLAMGSVDVIIESDLQPYDVQAVIALVHAAGGCFTDWQGNSAVAGGSVIASGSESLHEEVLTCIGARVRSDPS